MGTQYSKDNKQNLKRFMSNLKPFAKKIASKDYSVFSEKVTILDNINLSELSESLEEVKIGREGISQEISRRATKELEIFGIPIEAIYNEPLDLDWLTGKIWNNAQWTNIADRFA